MRLVLLLLLSLCAARAVAAAPRADARRVQAMAYGREALHAFGKGEFQRAADHYRKAAQVEPDVLQYVFGIARSEEELGHADAAIVALDDIASRAPPGSPLHAKAQRALARLRAATPARADPAAEVRAPAVVSDGTELGSGAVEAAPAPPPPAPVPAAVVGPPASISIVAEPRAAGWQRPVGWTGITVAVASLVASVALSAIAWDDQGHLDSNLMTDGRYDLARISKSEAVGRQQAINSLWTGAGISAGLCAATGALGTWLLLRHQPQAAPAIRHQTDAVTLSSSPRGTPEHDDPDAHDTHR